MFTFINRFIEENCKSNKHGPRAQTQVRSNSHILTYK